jgi:hypothetical protein
LGKTRYLFAVNNKTTQNQTMKKMIILALVALTTVVACTPKTEEATAPTTDSTAVTVDTTCAVSDSTAVADTTK